jgi:hypothetical protein
MNKFTSGKLTSLLFFVVLWFCGQGGTLYSRVGGWQLVAGCFAWRLAYIGVCLVVLFFPSAFSAKGVDSVCSFDATWWSWRVVLVG